MVTPIRTYRRLRELTQHEMARVLGVSQPTLHRWERGFVWIPDDHAVRLAEVLQINIELLLPYTEGYKRHFGLKGCPIEQEAAYAS